MLLAGTASFMQKKNKTAEEKAELELVKTT